ncbi:ankyrin repeat domain-containing protein [Lentisphaerota bacterium WC36G]|nr:ankyrin repeat domain-containing protein [Lentisphaerae bacterium WC36]
MKKITYLSINFILILFFCNTLRANNSNNELADDRKKIIEQFKDVDLNILKPWTKQSMDLISLRYNNRYHFAHLAAGKGDIEALKAVLKEYGTINQVGENNITPLFMAMTSFDLKIVRFLIENKAKIGGFSKEEELIYGTILTGSTTLEISEYLIKNGLPKNYRKKVDKTEATSFIGPIYFKGNYKLLEIFLKNNHYDKGFELDKIYELAIKKQQIEVLKILKKYNIKPGLYALLLMQNPAKEQLKLLETKLKNKKNTELREGLIDYALASFNPQTLELLLKYFPNEANSDYLKFKNSRRSFSVLNIAIAQKKNNLELLKILLKHGADVNPDKTKFITPIGYAVTQKNLEAIKILIKNGANFKKLDMPKKSFLAYIIAFDTTDEIFEYFLNQKLNLEYTNKGLTPLAWALKNERLEVVKLLLKYGAKREFIDPETKKSISIVDWTKKLNAKTPLKNYEKIIELLKTP